VVAAALYQTGKFTHENTVYVWGIIAGSAVGLLASTLGRLYASTYYALRDTRTPLRYASLRVALTVGLGYLCALPLPRWLGIDPHWGAAGLTASAGVAGWVEFTLLRRTLNARIGATGVAAPLIAKLWGSAAVGAAAAWGIKLAIVGVRPEVTAILVLVPYGLIYFAVTYLLRVEECGALFEKLAHVRR
jgi:putative peptidoglycan lipid II flippase